MNLPIPNKPEPVLCQKQNLLTNLPESQNAETIEILAERDGLRIERIVSFGQSTPVGMWYDQDEVEFVLVLQGHACLRFQHGTNPPPDDGLADRLLELRAGDFLAIPAHLRHRVEWTAPDIATIWFVIFHR